LAYDTLPNTYMTSPLLQRAQTAVGIACVLAIGAMMRYPGGTALDPTSRGYSLSRNFLSDLGMTVAYDHQLNRLGAALFVLSLLVLVAAFGYAVTAISRRLSDHPSARRWARFAAVCGLLACVAFTGVAVTPENHVMAVHVAFTLWGWRLIPIVAALLAVVSFQTTGLRARVTMVCLILTVVLASYAALLTWGPSVGSGDGLVFQVVAQKIATVVVIAALLFVTREFDRLPKHTALR
jgi:hypothetical membrane protein